ncbi:MAG: hypothetical protein AT707_00225 [Pyrobaculum sp. JCHS_4]|nr:MAG: hypothetical protein AT707_00225 [Pyrobaculum sp. JCHS_4]
MGPALRTSALRISPRLSADETDCEPEGRPVLRPADDATPAVQRAAACLRRPRSPGSAIDGFAPRGGLIEFRGRPCGTWGGRPHPQAPAGGRADSIGRAELKPPKGSCFNRLRRNRRVAVRLRREAWKGRIDASG